MDQNQMLQETLEQSLQEMNKKAMKELAAQIVSTVKQLQFGEPDKVTLLWEEKTTPGQLKEFIYSQGIQSFDYAMLLPQGKQSLGLEIQQKEVIELKLPQNILLILKNSRSMVNAAKCTG